MARIPTSGPISLGAINSEFGGASLLGARAGVNPAFAEGAGTFPFSGPLSFSDFRGLFAPAQNNPAFYAMKSGYSSSIGWETIDSTNQPYGILNFGTPVTPNGRALWGVYTDSSGNSTSIVRGTMNYSGTAGDFEGFYLNGVYTSVVASQTFGFGGKTTTVFPPSVIVRDTYTTPLFYKP